MVYLRGDADAARLREADRARQNRLEVVKALSTGEISRRDLFKWGLFTASGALALKHGFSPYAKSAYAAVPTGTPRSPLFGAQKFTQPLNRVRTQTPYAMTRDAAGNALFPTALGERPAKRLSYHNDFNANRTDPRYINPLSKRGPIEGRPPGEFFAHQRWDEFFPKVGYVSSLAPVANGSAFHPAFPAQQPNSVWTWGEGKSGRGIATPFMIKARYGEPVMFRAYNNLPLLRTENNGFGRNETQLHFHNAHNGAESDGAANVHHFPGTFYDYRWSTALARRDMINTGATDRRASAPNGSGGLNLVPGDWRELQGTMWCHDHRFFFTAENVYKGNLGFINIYSGRDRGNEVLNDGVNLRLPSGSALDWGNVDFDVNLLLTDAAFLPDGQLFFDIFDTDGFLGDVPLVNFGYAPFFEVLPRKYRFRLANCCMSRFLKLALVKADGTKVPFQMIANDGNFLVNPVNLTELDQQATGERYDIIVDFSSFKVGDTIKVVNLLQQTNGRMPDFDVSVAQALAGVAVDPMVGAILEFRVASSVKSVDAPGTTIFSSAFDNSQVPAILTEQIPIVAPVRTRVIEFVRGANTSRLANGKCIPDCPEYADFPWGIKINGQEAHSLNANRVSLLIPKPGDVEHWTYANPSLGWDHPIHLHFEEGVTMNRGGAYIPPQERNARKDVWRLRPGGKVQFQVRFGEFGGSYIAHCHNTVHEDFAMAARVQLINATTGRGSITPTPNPTPDGVVFTNPTVLPGARKL